MTKPSLEFQNGQWFDPNADVAGAATSAVATHAANSGNSSHLPTNGITDANVDPTAAITWAKVSKTGAVAGDVGADVAGTAASTVSAHAATTGNGKHIPSAGITDTHVATSAGIQWAKISAVAAITGSNIASATIAAANIVNATITGAKIASGTITNTNIASTATRLAPKILTSQTVATSGTITTKTGSTGYDVVEVSAASAATGVTLSAGNDGQDLRLINTGSSAITISNVGTGLTLGGGSALGFIYSSTLGKWIQI